MLLFVYPLMCSLIFDLERKIRTSADTENSKIHSYAATYIGICGYAVKKRPYDRKTKSASTLMTLFRISSANESNYGGIKLADRLDGS